MKIVFLNYNILPNYLSPEEWINKISPSAPIMELLSERLEVHYFIRIGYKGNHQQNGVQYHCCDTHVLGKYFPVALHKAVQKINPDIVLVFGLHFPLQIIQLKKYLSASAKIIAEHHADIPFRGIKKYLQQWADTFIDQYHFTTFENANDWLVAKIISDKNKCQCRGLASTHFSRKEKTVAKKILGLQKQTNFLFVGRLNENKDPITLLKAYANYLLHHEDTALHLIFQTDELYEQVHNCIQQNEKLKKNVHLHGKKNHKELELWYSAADYIISTSHRESGSFSIIEAMACGCIPIVSNIPSSLKTIGFGKYGFSFKPGDAEALSEILLMTDQADQHQFSLKIENYFHKHLSFPAITNDFYEILIN